MCTGRHVDTTDVGLQQKTKARQRLGVHLPRTGALHSCGREQRPGNCQCLRKCQGEIRREASEREEPRSGVIKAKAEKKYQYGLREHQSSSA